MGSKETRRQRSSILRSRIDPPGMSQGEKEVEAPSERCRWRGDLGTCEGICRRMTRRCIRFGIPGVGIVVAAAVVVVEVEGKRWIRIGCYRLDWMLTWQKEGVGMSWVRVGSGTTGSRRGWVWIEVRVEEIENELKECNMDPIESASYIERQS